jgi:hypothetical protein
VHNKEESGGRSHNDLGLVLSHLFIGGGKWNPNGPKRFA